MLGFFVAAFGLWFAGNQFRQARRSLEATTIYNIQKQSGDLLASIAGDRDVYNYIIHYDANADNTALYQRAQPAIERLVQFYSTVYNQWRMGVIADVFWRSISKEICAFFQDPPVKRWWNERGAKGRYNDDFKKFVGDCIGR